MTIEVLRGARVFADLPDEVLADLAAAASTRTLAPGEVLITEGDAADAAFVVVSGELEVLKATPSGEMRVNLCGPGEPIGELALASGSPRSATVRATEPTEVLEISVASFNAVLSEPRAVMALLDTVRRRLQHEEAQLRQHAKMIALGRQTAGLLHELNNPAAAIRRNIDQLGEVIEARTAQAAALADLDREGWAVLARLADDARQLVQRDSLDQADLADELTNWMDDHGVDQPEELAEVLVATAIGVDALDQLAAQVPSSSLGAALAWLTGGVEASQLLTSSGIAARRISEVVAAARSYVRLDEAPVGTVRIRDGIESALVLLGHKARAGVDIVRHYADDVPDVEGYPAELNTVWTNLLDNALDAVADVDDPRVVIATSFADDRVVVEVTDNGGGIDAEQRERIFDPFFTTKGVGEGTGLGLSQSLTIVAQRHHGRLDVSSEPGRTTFRVELPVRLAGPAPA